MAIRAERLQKLQREHGYTNRYIATILHVNENTVSRWVSGKRQPGQLSLNQLAALFKVSIEYLNGLTDDPTPPPDDIGELTDEEREWLRVYRRGGKKALKRHLGEND